MFDVDVRKHGPVFDGRAERIVDAFLEDARQEIAEEGAEDVRQALHPGHGYRSGFYQSHVQAHMHKVDDGGVVYGPWLEGTSHRNRTTRFKGYYIFRLTAQRLQEKAGVIAERVLPKYLREMQ